MKISFHEFQELQKLAAGEKLEARSIQLDESQREIFEERAAIFEFCAGLNRSESERRALAEALATSPPNT
ncbi:MULTISPECIES: hypothetical protein [unclassified Thiomonas]|jgi:hypothetical protein|uniref:hypothetical protein n=1 Tax=unclassified Thiomonas TaxID=2625466 RepID=UPI000BD810CB|nr:MULTISPECIES: hypothetical protein [unclassified Thiomonas]OZB71359.1 MAG: hypothetical protein B7X30_04670 [Thiomonas sp. 13-64-67]